MDHLPAPTATMAITLTPVLLTGITERHGSPTASLSVPAPGTVGDGDPGAGVDGVAGAGDAVGVEAGVMDTAFMAAAVLLAAVLLAAVSRDVASPVAVSQVVGSQVAARLEDSTVEPEADSMVAAGFMAVADLTGVEAVDGKHGLQ
jgi:hypothetical protein